MHQWFVEKIMDEAEKKIRKSICNKKVNWLLFILIPDSSSLPEESTRARYSSGSGNAWSITESLEQGWVGWLLVVISAAASVEWKQARKKMNWNFLIFMFFVYFYRVWGLCCYRYWYHFRHNTPTICATVAVRVIGVWCSVLWEIDFVSCTCKSFLCTAH